MILLTFGLGLALAGPLPADAPPRPPVSAPVSAVPASPSDRADPGWQAVEDARGGTGFARALDEWLTAHPHGPLAARALSEQAALRGDLAGALGLLRRAVHEGRDAMAGSAASLELARLEYAQGRPDAALASLEGAAAWPRPEALRPEWLYWRGQSRLALKQWALAARDFRQVAAVWPGHALVDAARLGEADSEAALGDGEGAAEAYGGLAAGGGAFAAQALWGLGTLRLRQGRLDDAREAFLNLRTGYPASFEARAAPAKLAEIAARSRTGSGVRASGRWSIQVGAYSKFRWADALAGQLRGHRFRVKVQKKNVDGRTLYLVKVGPYASRPAASAAAQILQSREKLPFNLVEE